MIHTQPSNDSYSTYSACFPCYNLNVVSDDEDSDYHVPAARRDQRRREPPGGTSFSTTGSAPPLIPDGIASKDLLMAYHIRLGHLPFPRIQLAARQGILPRRLADCAVPQCASCLFGKAKRRSWRTRGPAGHIGHTATKPGDVVSVDQLISKTPGLIAQVTGKLTKRRHSVATIFVDHVSGLDFVHPQESTSAEDTLIAKQAFERFASRHNVLVKHYHCDNGIFASKKFRDAVDSSGQTITFCGVNAHHQNGVAERRIQDLADRTRSMLVNARHRNPFATDHLWPFALRLASEIDRSLPKRSNTQSPLELFTGVDVRPKTNHFRPFGCPVYVLTTPLQAGKSQPKWQDRARVGCYLGLSSQHATSVSLILHPRTGHVSPQFHCVFDENFETLSDLGRFATLWPPSPRLPNPVPADYSALRVPPGLDAPWFLQDHPADDDSSTSSHDPSTPDVPPLDPDAPDPADHLYAPPPLAPAPDSFLGEPFQAPPASPEIEGGPENEGGPDGTPDRTAENEGGAPASTPENEGGAATPRENEGDGSDTNRSRGAPASFRSRSGRTVKVSEKVLDSSERFGSINPAFSTKLAVAHFYALVTTMLDDATFNVLHPFSYVASLADKDTMNFNEAMKQSDRDKFVIAMEKEVSDHVQREHWKIYSRTEMRRTGYSGRVIMAVWSFKRKRNPFGVITKYKA